jgi:hypothetical protein
MAGEPWAPDVSDVARHIPTRTRDTKTPGSDALLGTFNGNTTPSDSVAQQMIDDTVASLEAQFGDMPGIASQHPDAATAIRVYVEWRVAADIELAYPNRDADIQTAAALDKRAVAQLAVVAAALAVSEVGTTAVNPDGNFPVPDAYADQSPGSGAEFMLGRFVPNGGWPFV